jgi:hypothetical protein
VSPFACTSRYRQLVRDCELLLQRRKRSLCFHRNGTTNHAVLCLHIVLQNTANAAVTYLQLQTWLNGCTPAVQWFRSQCGASLSLHVCLLQDTTSLLLQLDDDDVAADVAARTYFKAVDASIIEHVVSEAVPSLLLDESEHVRYYHIVCLCIYSVQWYQLVTIAAIVSAFGYSMVRHMCNVAANFLPLLQ